ncbi:MAG TPA: M23 family metallopeptidase [Thermoanaerobaculia bacterium]|nr:M23 family metallopeptidase [Thermoanaerobaculia bacterium]
MQRIGDGGSRHWLWGATLPAALLLFTGLALEPPPQAGPAAPDTAAELLDAPSMGDAPEPALERVARELRSGETLSRALADLGFDRPGAHEVSEVMARWIDPRRLRPGVELAAHRDDGDVVRALELTLDGKGVLSLQRGEESWEGSWREFERTAVTRSVRGVLEGGLEGALANAGAPGELAYAVAEVLQWDLDFNRDLRRGDEFEVLFEERFLEGRPAGLGEVLAVRYVNRGRAIEAYRFAEGAYYDAEGRPLQKMFLRSPMPYSRITSRFSSRRFHPVLKVHRPHYGVDYGAPTGTPARVTASGVVAFMGWDGGGGKTVKVRHPNGYLTAYLHLSRFPSGLRVGDRVQQGEVIGYVGSTGLSTGPHLDYRVQKSGRWIDPLSLRSVPADPVPTTRLADFRALRDAMRVSLESGAPFAPPEAPSSTTRLAAAGSTGGGGAAPAGAPAAR